MKLKSHGCSTFQKIQNSSHIFDFCFDYMQDPSGFIDEKSESRLYVGNLDLKITEASLIKMFSPYGKIVSEDFLWHTRGPKRGEPRGFAFIQFSTKEVSCLLVISSLFKQFLISTFKVSMQEAKLAKEKMHGRLALGRPLVVRLASEKYLEEAAQNPSKGEGETNKTGLAGSTSEQMNRSVKIAAIKNKLKALEEENHSAKKQKQADKISSNNNSISPDHPSCIR
ncbi:hypothetical protein Ddye_013827 [Dipteronia dyeriana]|uniref:RRM domain-containing protein n=1 Tax=Dipteronia dyeriana TaxID=168575 RepID=A0AAD9X6U5_9ROSI|nr:hypothetical protein Ddye_013827 [Dipteronia dyeriana]